jgi:hypothetical protein
MDINTPMTVREIEEGFPSSNAAWTANQTLIFSRRSSGSWITVRERVLGQHGYGRLLKFWSSGAVFMEVSFHKLIDVELMRQLSDAAVDAYLKTL